MRQELIKEACLQRPDFDLNAHDGNGKTVLDLAVRFNDLEFARYLLGQGAMPERTSLGAASHDMQALLTSWRRKNLLYAHFNEGGRHFLDRLLYEGRHEEVQAAMADMLEKKGIQKVWKEAMDAGEHDVLRALLVISAPDELRKLTKDKHLVGQWLDSLRDDPGLSAVLKEFPYQSAKRGKPDNHNGKAKFTGTNEKIVCRHLAIYQQVQQAKSPRIKFNYDQFSSEDAIEGNVTSDIEETYATLKAQASETHLVLNKNFGRFLARKFEEMEENGKQSTLMLVESTNHAMNVGLRIKHKDDTQSYVAKFFDPNETTTETRSKANNVKTFETQTLESYVTDAGLMNDYYPKPVDMPLMLESHVTDADSMNDYYSKSVDMSLIFVRPEEEAEASVSLNSSVDRTLTSMDIEDINGMAIWYLMREGFTGSLKQLRDHFTGLPEDKLIELMAAKDVKGIPGFFISMQKGDLEIIKVWGELLEQCESIPSEKLIELLAGKKADGMPALFMGMNEGRAEAVTAWGELVKQFKSIPLDQIIELIAGRSADGYSAFFMAMSKGHAEAIKAWGELFKQFESIPKEQCIDLIAEKNANGMPALFVAMHQGNAEAIRAYGEVLKQFEPIPKAKLIELLAGKDSMGFSALYAAMNNGHIEAIKAYGELLKQFESILGDECVELLSAKNEDGFPALYICMQDGQAESIKSYGELLKQFESIPQEQLVELMAAKNPAGDPALMVCMQKGNVEAIKAYGELLQQFDSIPQDRIFELIAGINNKGLSAFFASMFTGQEEAVKAYGDLLKLLPPDEQAELLLAKFPLGHRKGKSGLHIALEKGHFKAANELLQLLTQLAPALSEEQRAMLQNESKDCEEIFDQSTTTSSSSLQEWIKLKGAFSALKAELS